jgi:thiol-disulfide isomerase/thioredoxin
MRKTFILLIILLGINPGCKTSRPASTVKGKETSSSVSDKKNDPSVVNFSDKSTWILGYFKPERLTQEPYASWYVKEYEDYQISSDAINRLLDISKDNIQIKIIMGTWCPDSRREVPRMARILDIWRFPVSQVTYIGVDKDKNAKVIEYESLKIEKVPTFVIYKNNSEAGRIIETPVTSLEQDMLNILTGMNKNN